MSGELNNLKNQGKVLDSQKILFQKISLMHGNSEFSKTKVSNGKFPIEAEKNMQ